MKYYDVQKHWRKVKLHIEHPDIQGILVADFNKHTYGRWRRPFKLGHRPADFDPCDWRYSRKGRRPAFWRYVTTGACYWLVNFHLKLAQRVEPRRQWRILRSAKHATVWDGDEMLFDLNFLALGIAPDECFALANKAEAGPALHLPHGASGGRSHARQVLTLLVPPGPA